MKYIFLVAFDKGGGKKLIKVKSIDGKETWATTSEAAFEYAKRTCVKDQEYEFQTEEKNGQLHIALVGKGNTKEEVETVAEPKCEDCGAILKDNKYKKCYTCNKKNPVPKTEEKKSCSTGESIVKQCALKASCHAVATAMQGQIQDVETLGEMITKLYEKIYPIIK